MTILNKKTDTFTNVRVSGWNLIINDRFPSDLAGELHDRCAFDNVRGPFEEITASKFARTYKCDVGFAGQTETLFVKHYLYRSWLDFAKHLIRKSRATRAFDASLMLENNDINAPQIVALGTRNVGMVTTKSFLITREVKHAKAVFKCFEENWKTQNESDISDRNEFVHSLGTTVGRMHKLGIFHGDMRIGNVFARKTDEQWEFFFLDNERTRKSKRLPRKLIIKNLVQLNMHRNDITDDDRDAFFKAYLSEYPLDDNKKRQLTSDVLNLTDKRLKAKSNR